jgi:type I restriction enzyme M protein
MLDTDTKRRIDTARDILVGKVPDPKSQVEQITIALIYKFMDDMDAESEELGGKRKFFEGDFARYGWARLMDRSLGGNEMLGLYGEGIARMPENPGIPPLFRDIFKNAYLPYRDPETLKMFLKVIDEFSYDHSERLGDAFEYLLSVLGSQGDAGQFRTPRHIIDFMVEVIDPKKTETVLDPACGTAGFLISSYKHILKANTDAKGDSTLTPDEKGRLAQNFRGYDISPDMVRLSLVNMYLHGFVDPHIYEYDTLASQDKWNEYADVILANPPFMSPKGGIMPHKRFSVQSKRSEVLFVDYMAEHLTPTGRAAIIVPEGIIFQSQGAYKQLRKMLVDDYLVAVVSLPAGVFNPYSGVKTSILILDKPLAKKTSTIAFFKVENDGFGLGAQRRVIDKNDLPATAVALQAFCHSLEGTSSPNVSIGEGNPNDFDPNRYHNALVVEKTRIAANGDYNLSEERYREGVVVGSQEWPRVHLSDITVYSKAGEVIDRGYWEKGEELLYTCADEPIRSDYPNFPANKRTVEGDILLARNGYGYAHLPIPGSIYTNVVQLVKVDCQRANPSYVYQILKSQISSLQAVGQGIPSLNMSVWNQLEIPLPPLEVQKEIVAEIEGYQKVIDGARAVLDNYRPHIPIDPDWPMVKLSEVCEINPETVNPSVSFPNKTIFYVDISSVENGTGEFLGYTEMASEEAPSRARRGIRNGDVLLSTVRPNLKAFTIMRSVCERAIASTGFAVLRSKQDVMDAAFLLVSISSDDAVGQMIGMSGRGAYPSINQSDVAAIKIPLPPLATQQVIVAEIEAEQKLVAANRELIARFEKKIQATLARVWGEETCQGGTR